MFKTWGRILIWIGNNMESRIHVQNIVRGFQELFQLLVSFRRMYSIYAEYKCELFSVMKGPSRNIVFPR